MNLNTGKLVSNYLTYFITVVPEKEAEFVYGQDALLNYLKEKSKEKTLIIQKDQLRPGQFRFTVTKDGEVANVRLNSSSGYPSVDTTLMELISSLKGKWNPATNAKGEAVDQELIFFFGMEGC